jgi:hypothetical protein
MKKLDQESIEILCRLSWRVLGNFRRYDLELRCQCRFASVIPVALFFWRSYLLLD